MKKAILTNVELQCQNPPSPYLTWSEEAVKAWLVQQGFDLTKPIKQSRDLCCCAITYTQEDK